MVRGGSYSKKERKEKRGGEEQIGGYVGRETTNLPLIFDSPRKKGRNQPEGLTHSCDKKAHERTLATATGFNGNLVP